MELETEIPLREWSDYNDLYFIMQQPFEELGRNIFLNLRDQTYFKPIEILMIVMFTIYMRNRNANVIILPPIDEKARNYLNDIDLMNFCATNTYHPTTLASNSNTSMPIRRLDVTYLKSYTESTISFYKSIASGKEMTMFDLTIAELINNVYDHANSTIDAYIFSQYFPSQKRISIIVGDYGIGIPVAVNNHLIKHNQPEKSECDCIDWAIQLKHSTESKPHNKGMGLNILYSFIKDSNSFLKIYSNGALLCSNRQNDRYLLNPIQHFKGTIVEVDINIDGLCDEEFLIDDFWENF